MPDEADGYPTYADLLGAMTSVYGPPDRQWEPTMPDQPDHATTEPHADYGVWPGGAFVAARVSHPGCGPDHLYLSNVETGRVTVARLWRETARYARG